jgi:hypothetical protein
MIPSFKVEVDLKNKAATVELSVDKVQADSPDRNSWYYIQATSALEDYLKYKYRGVKVLECLDVSTYVCNFGASRLLSGMWSFTLEVPEKRKTSRKKSTTKTKNE